MPHNIATFIKPERFKFDDLNGKLIEINGYPGRIDCCPNDETFSVLVKFFPPGGGEPVFAMHLTESEVNAIKPSINPDQTDYLLQWQS